MRRGHGGTSLSVTSSSDWSRRRSRSTPTTTRRAVSTSHHWSVGRADVAGIADLVTLEPVTERESVVHSRVLEVKTAHQIRVAIYSLLLDAVVRDLGFGHDPKATVVNREADLRDIDLDELEYIHHASRAAEVKRLLKRDGEFHDLYRQSFTEVGYQLDRNCEAVRTTASASRRRSSPATRHC